MNINPHYAYAAKAADYARELAAKIELFMFMDHGEIKLGPEGIAIPHGEINASDDDNVEIIMTVGEVKAHTASLRALSTYLSGYADAIAASDKDERAAA